jgi:hypothetical protein
MTSTLESPEAPATPAGADTNFSATSAPDAAWSKLVPEEQWVVFAAGTSAFDAAGIPYLLHGAMALATYTGHWRNTKDIDVIVRVADHERAVAALRSAGFEDYFPHEAYDRSWIFRGYKDGVLFDVIWELPNHRVHVDDGWFEHARPLWLRGKLFATVPAEELIRVKLYVLQRERCDWVDVLNVLAGAVHRIDWQRLVERMGRDLPLLQGVLAVFNWLSPQRARAVPEWLRQQFALAPIEVDDAAAAEERRVRLFDSRPWFALHQPIDQVLER